MDANELGRHRWGGGGEAPRSMRGRSRRKQAKRGPNVGVGLEVVWAPRGWMGSPEEGGPTPPTSKPTRKLAKGENTSENLLKEL